MQLDGRSIFLKQQETYFRKEKMAGGKTKESFHILGSAQFFSGGEQNDSTGIFTWKHSESILMRQFWQFPPVSSVCDEEAGLPP